MTMHTQEVEVLEESENVNDIAKQALWVLVHSLVAIASWVGMILFISAVRQESVPVLITLALSFAIPFATGYLFTRFRQNGMGSHIWLVGMIWFLIICLWILDMPTGPNQCYQCDATQKLYLTFFSLTKDSGLIDGQGRFIGTWPAVAFIGYSIGSRIPLKKKRLAI